MLYDKWTAEGEGKGFNLVSETRAGVNGRGGDGFLVVKWGCFFNRPIKVVPQILSLSFV